MDTTYVAIMLIVFLVLTGLAVDIGYLYVSEEDLQSAAETAALAGTGAMKQRVLYRMQSDPKKIVETVNDTGQSAARVIAVETVSGKHSAAALVGLANSGANALTDDNDVTVGFWNVSSQSYTPGGTPVNAMQVRTRRTAESSSVGLGSLGSFLARITGTETFGSTPVAIAALPTTTRSNLAVCSAACDPGCSYPDICTVKERRMTRAPIDPRPEPSADRYLYTSLLHPASVTNSVSDMVCGETPSQQVCGRPIYTSAGQDDGILRDIHAMMYNPNYDRSNKEYDKSGRLAGWWMIVPAIDCGGATAGNTFEPHTVTRYSLVRISRICTSGPVGCPQQSGGRKDTPATACAPGEDGLYLDRISCIGCDSRNLALLPGLQPILVK